MMRMKVMRITRVRRMRMGGDPQARAIHARGQRRRMEVDLEI